jgi:hypothetical protein
MEVNAAFSGRFCQLFIDIFILLEGSYLYNAIVLACIGCVAKDCLFAMAEVGWCAVYSHSPLTGTSGLAEEVSCDFAGRLHFADQRAVFQNVIMHLFAMLFNTRFYEGEFCTLKLTCKYCIFVGYLKSFGLWKP